MRSDFPGWQSAKTALEGSGVGRARLQSRPQSHQEDVEHNQSLPAQGQGAGPQVAVQGNSPIHDERFPQ